MFKDIKQQKFIPHITIGRIKSAKNKEKILEIVDKYKTYKFANIRVDSIYLSKSPNQLSETKFTIIIPREF